MIKKLSAIVLALIVLSTVSLSVFADEIPTSTAIDLSTCKITLETTEYVYSGTEKTPKVTVENNGVVYKKDVDYTVAYSDNIKAGNAKVTVKAVENSTVLTGSVVKTFKIDRKNIDTFKHQVLSGTEFTYVGKAVTPKITLSDSKTTAKLNTDYTVTYKNNWKIGIATVTAKGIGNYNGSVSKTFTIKPAPVKNISFSKIKENTLTISWSSVVGNISGYRIYRYDANKKDYVLAATTKNNYFNVSGRDAGTVYTYMIKAYLKTGNTVILSDDGVVKSVTTKPQKVNVVPSYYKGKNFVFKWEKVNASGYEIKYSKDKAMKKGVKVCKVKSKNAVSKKIKLSSKKQYYYKIRAYATAGGKTVYGAWSDKKTTQFSNVYSSFTTSFFSSYVGRTTNIKKACSYIDGTILRPNDVFSFNAIVGRRTPERGFKEATVYSGQSVTTGYGGGVCQVSTTLFNAALLGNLTITERYQHTMKVHYVVSGRDAAISWGSNDLKFRNSTNSDIKISAKVRDNSKIEIKFLTNTLAKPKKVSLKVSKSGKNYTLTRSVDGKVNYTTRSTY